MEKPIRTDSKKLWFRAKTFGWGWYPVSWQGWLIIFLFIALFAGSISTINIVLNFSIWAPIISCIIGFILVGGLIFISYKKGEKPSWRWGNSDKTR